MRKLLVIFTLSLFASGCQAQNVATTDAPLQLATNGKTSYVIALAADAIPAEKTAAQQLQQNLQTVTGAQWPIQAESAVAANAPQILVGAGTRAKSLLPVQNWKSLKHDGIVIKTVGNKLVLAGGRPRGTLYAVYQFLEDAVGCRYWTIDESDIPNIPSLKILPQNVSYVPAFDYRENYVKSVRLSPEFAVKMRQNGHSQPQTVEWGGHYSILGWCHTFKPLLPLEKYFKEHPEWYPDPQNGYQPSTSASKMPHGDETQLCLTNPAVVEELTKNALGWIAENPEAGYISISQNDTRNFCRCAKCSALEEAEGSPSGPVVNFVNQVAARIGDKYPDFLVETLAYQSTEKAPKTIRPAKNVLIRFAPIDADFSRPLSAPQNQSVRENIEAWSKISTNMFAWNYVTNFVWPVTTHPNWAGLGPDLRFFAANKVTGVFEQGDTFSRSFGDFIQLRTWLLSKLMWNASLDQEKLIDEFMAGYYGAAAPSLRQYLKVVQDSFLKQNRKLGQDNADFSYLSLEVMNQGNRLFDAAEAAVKNDEKKLFRVQRERLVLELAWLTRYKRLKLEARQTGQQFLGPTNPKKLLAEFPARVNRYGDDIFMPHGDFPNMLAQMVELPEFARQFPEEDVFDFQQDGYILYLIGKLTSIINDPAASDGKAARMTANTGDWAAQAPGSWFLDGTTRSKWHVYAYVRVPLKAGVEPTGVGVNVGIYDKELKKPLTELEVPLQEIAGEQYVRVDLGIHNLSSQNYVYFFSSNSPNVENIYIDRVIFVRE